MTPEQWVLLLGAAATVAGAAGALLRVRHDRQAGVSGNEREAKRDERADWAAFAAEYRQALSAERSDSAQLRDTLAAKDERIDELERRLDAKDAAIRARDDHIDALEHHIWQGLGPPPPPRPAGI